MSVSDFQDYSMTIVGDKLICKFNGRFCACSPCEEMCDSIFLKKVPIVEKI